MYSSACEGSIAAPALYLLCAVRLRRVRHSAYPIASCGTQEVGKPGSEHVAESIPARTFYHREGADEARLGRPHTRASSRIGGSTACACAGASLRPG